MGEQNKRAYDEPDDLPSDDRYQYWPQYLRISPSYQMAHKLWCGELTVVEIPSHVRDFELVMQTYEHFGDVFNRSVPRWWKETASSLFAPKIAGLNWKVHKVWQYGEDVDRSELEAAMDDYCQITRPNLGNPLTLLASIPLDMKYEDILSSLKQAFRFYRRSRRDLKGYSPPTGLYAIEGIEKDPKTLEARLKLVYAIAKKPKNKTRWEVGFDLEINKTLSRIYNYAAGCTQRERDRINIQVSNNLASTLRAAENAARGKFYDSSPSSMHINKFDFVFLSELRDAYEGRVEDLDEHFAD